MRTLRAFRDEDVDPLFAIQGDHEAMRYTYAAPSRQDCAHRLRTFAALASTLGFAPWTVVLRTEARVIGWGGLSTDIHARLRDSPYRPYTQLLQQALREAMTQWGVLPTPHASETLLAMVRAIPPYPDVPACLSALATPYRLAIISNTEDQLIAETVRGLGVPFEVITAAQAQAFKPDHRLFTYAFARLGCRASEVVHVGAGYPTDMVPAFELGIARIWINRRGEQGDPRTPPTRELPDLTALPSCIASLAAGGAA